MAEVLCRKRALCPLQIIETGSARGAADVLELDPSVDARRCGGRSGNGPEGYSLTPFSRSSRSHSSSMSCANADW
ncbi:hypothetical protein LMG31506_03558 [Cupriavidus yeoncheonensis]|uniref:Uncharacterized protein n=1 Tax=Cupriavidus yeoncheonensis TaxID=1462994 RepID=A0A916MYM1_9BURK|nr:hypothetical protein LMG31506_03558 [Cupriavidus yeoncheonensis]